MSHLDQLKLAHSSDEDESDEEGIIKNGEMDIDDEKSHANASSTETNLMAMSSKPSDNLNICDTSTSRRKRFSVWSDMLLDEGMADCMKSNANLVGEDVNKVDRNCENYSFWVKRQLEESEGNVGLGESSKSTRRCNIKPKKKKKKKKDKKDRSGKHEFASKKKHVVVEMIARKLHEPKRDLISKYNRIDI